MGIRSRTSSATRLSPTARRCVLSMATAICLLNGCSKSEPEPEANPAEAPYLASGGAAPGQELRTDQALQQLADSMTPTESAQNAMAESIAAGPTQVQTELQSQTPSSDLQAEMPAPAKPAPKFSRTQLPPDLSPKQLVEFLGIVDRDMQGIWSRLPQVQGGRDELIRIAKMKLEAARRLKNHAEADEKSKSAGARGELQALSHLASFSDLQSAQMLEELATENLQSGDPELVADSRLVLIGFALEALQNGDAGAADRVIGYIDQIAASSTAKDVPTLMVMGQSRDALAGYGYDQHANRVRDAIIELYADSPNPDLAMAAAELAGNAVFDEAERLLSQTLKGEAVAVDQWRAAIDQVLADAPDLQTVEYLAGSALQFEALGLDELVESTFEAMTSVFKDPDSNTGREVRIAMAAKDARHDIVGVRFNPVLPSVDGSPLSMEQYQDRIVLVPFWAAAFPESLQLIGTLKEIQTSHPDDVAIVGVNLDGNDALLQEFVDQNQLGFPSFRSKSSAEAEVANTVAAQFGIASMPFLAIVNREGQVAAVNFTGQGIQETIDKLLAQ